ncbi:MAG: 7-carboxy-7-deazaguanine synthase QueE, partial [Acidobacteriota bacterium]|nr:7-carboxy-7-deazaguanine synthase QueE [Acidobacteriota bacterium]
FDAILQMLSQFGCNLVEVTGGEPLAQKNVFPFITEVCDEGYEVLVETGGYISIEDVDARATIILDIKCPASGESARNHWPNLERLRPEMDEVKFVIADIQDWEFAKEIIKKFDLSSRAKEILISPIYGMPDLSEIAEAVAASGLTVRFNLQLHKYIWGADVRGV